MGRYYFIFGELDQAPWITSCQFRNPAEKRGLSASRAAIPISTIPAGFADPVAQNVKFGSSPNRVRMTDDDETPLVE
jgi:hypothetical protein